MIKSYSYTEKEGHLALFFDHCCKDVGDAASRGRLNRTEFRQLACCLTCLSRPLFLNFGGIQNKEKGERKIGL